jgi:two-component system OmpR family sensor kinase
MKKNSILFTLNLTFIIAFVIISSGFFLLYNMYEKKEQFFLHKRSGDMSRMFLREFLRDGLSPELQEQLSHFQFTLIDNPKIIDEMLKDKKLLMRPASKKRAMKIYDLEFEGKALTYIVSPKVEVILQDDAPRKSNLSMAMVIYVAILALFSLLYFSIVSKLRPLKKLRQVVENLGNEDFDVELTSEHKDEISKLMNEFSLAAKKLKRLKESRNIFIRNIMHELKTPITKGKFLLHLPQTPENLQIMQKVFYRLEALIGEFATLEELMSTKKELQKKEYLFEDILDNAADILMCNEEEVAKEFDSFKVNVDFDLFSIALKNLLDNGIKYSSEKKVIVKNEGEKIIFENKGKELQHPLEEYFEPFFRGNRAVSNQSFGLGLYILKNILDAHKMVLEYEYKNGLNRFVILLPH